MKFAIWLFFGLFAKGCCKPGFHDVGPMYADHSSLVVVHSNAVDLEQSYAFCGGSIGEARYANIKGNKLTKFSYDQLIKCIDKKSGDSSSVLMEKGLKHMSDFGLLSETQFKTCEDVGYKFHSTMKHGIKATIGKYEIKKDVSIRGLRDLVNLFPVCVEMQAGEDFSGKKDDGVYNCPSKEAGKKFWVLVYGFDAAKEVWFVKGPGGSKWGKNGLGKVAFAKAPKLGTCGIGSSVAVGYVEK